MKRTSLLAAACVFASTGALAQQSQLGLGISHGDTGADALSMDTAISVPILSGGILIEPYLAYASDNTEIEGAAPRPMSRKAC